jgi:hypothetical protein
LGFKSIAVSCRSFPELWKPIAVFYKPFPELWKPIAVFCRSFSELWKPVAVFYKPLPEPPVNLLSVSICLPVFFNASKHSDSRVFSLLKLIFSSQFSG